MNYKARVIFYDNRGRLVAKTIMADMWLVHDEEEKHEGLTVKFEKGRTNIEVLISTADIKRMFREAA